MRKIYFLLFTVLFTAISNAQLTGTKNIPGDYATLALAVTDLNAQGVGAGGVILNLIVSNPQIAPIGGYSITATGTLSNPITIQGNGNTITASAALVAGDLNDAIFKLIGSDYVTLTGFTMQENAANTITAAATNNMTEWGVALLYASVTDGAQNNTISNNTISLNRLYSNTFGIYSNVRHSATVVTTTADATTASGSNTGNKIYNNAISNVDFGVIFIGSSIAAAMDSGNDIGGLILATGNTITNWGGLVSGAASLYAGMTTSATCILMNHQVNENVSFNTVVSATNITTLTTTGFIGIFKSYFVTQPSGTITANYNNNTVTLTNAPTTAQMTGMGLQNLINLSTATFNCNNNNIINCANTGAAATTSTMIGMLHSSGPGVFNINGNTIRGFSTTSTSGSVIGIQHQTNPVSSALNMNNNKFGDAIAGFVTFANATAQTGSLTALAAVSPGGGGAAASLSMSNNDFRGVVHTTTGSGANTYITNSGAALTQNITNNTFTNLSVNTTGSITFISNSNTLPANGVKNVNNNAIVTGFTKTGAGGTVTFFTDNGSDPATSTNNTNNNTFSNISITGATSVTGIANTNGGTPNKNVVGNTISNISGGTTGTIIGLSINFDALTTNVTSNAINTITNGGAITGILFGTSGTNGTTNASLNTVHSLTGTGTGVVTGITLGGTNTTTRNLFKNKIYNLENSSSSTGTVNGILISSGALAHNVYNNLIGDLRAPSANNATDAVRGINITSTTTLTNINVYFNTIYINAASTGTNFGTTGIFHTISTTATTAALTLRGNIIYNSSTANGTGLTVAYRRSGGAANNLANYDANSNRNDFYAGTPGASNLIYSDGTSSAQTIAAYKAGVFTAGTIAPRDGSSVSDAFAPATFFQSTTGSSPNFLKYNTGIALQVESGAIPIAGITDDYIGTVRDLVSPDVGAWELNGIAADLNGPAIIYPMVNNPSCVNNVFISAAITDPSGVDVAPGTKPRLYFKKLTDANTYAGNTNADNGWKYVEASNSSSPFSFTTDYALLQSPVVLGDVIQYFVVAQDMAGTPNVGVNNAVFNAAPTSVALTAGAFPVSGNNGYAILPPPTVDVTADPNPVCVGDPTTLTMIASQFGFVASGTGTASSSTYTPYYGSTSSARRIQYILTATELQSLGLRAGNITSASFNLNSVPTAINISDFTLKIGHTGLSVLAGTFSSDASQTVFSGSYSPVAGINTHVFSTAFAWDGTSNIIIEACHGVVGTSSLTTVFYSTGYPTGTSCYSTNAAGCGQATGTNTTIRPNITLTGQVGITSQYVNFVWNDGSGPVGTNSNVTVVNPPFPSGNTMTYTVVATDANGCTANGSVIVNKNTTTPTGTASVNNNTVCFGQTLTFIGTATMGCPPYTYSWSDGTSTVGTGDTLIYAPTTNATYTLTITDNAGQTFSPAGIPITVNNPQVTGTTPGNACAPGPVSVQLGATGSAGTTLNWYDVPSGGSPIGTGSPFNTPAISSTTTYYVTAEIGANTESAGKSAPVGTTNTSGNNWGLVFDVVNTPIVLNSVKIYSVGATPGVMSVNLTDNTGTIIATAGPFNYAAGSTSVPTIETLTLNFAIPIGTGYRLVSSSMSGGAVIRETSGNTYPYSSISGNVVVTSGFITNPGSATYYWFYDWLVTSGCESSRTPVVATIVPLPTTFNVTGGGNYCAGGTGVAVGLDGSETGVNYQLQVNSVNTGSPVAGTGAAISFGSQTAAGTYTVVATTVTASCTNTMNGSALVTIDPAPTAFAVTGGGGYCSGGSGVAVGLSGSESGVNYQLQLNTVNTGAPVAGTGASISFGNQTAAGTYTVVATNTTTTCTNIMTGSVMVSIEPLPTQFNVTGGGAYCSGGTGVPVGLDGSESGVSYQLQLNTVNTGSPVAGTGAAISFGSQTGVGTYTVVATIPCANPMNGSVMVSVNSLPATYNVTGGGTYCTGGSGVPVGLSNSETGVNYQLRLNSVNTGAPVAGTGAAIGFGNQTSAGTYTVVATNTTTTCTATMTGSVIVAISAIVVNNPVVTTGQVGNAFSQSFTQTGGIGAITYTTTSTLPAGLTLATTGVLSGTPLAAGTFPIIVRATDATPCFADGTTYNLVITAGPTSSVLSATGPTTICSGASTYLSVAITGGTSPYSVVINAAPGGNFTVNNYVSGTNIPVSPTINTTYSLVSVTDANSNPGTGNSGTVNITVNPTPNAVATPASQTICSGSTITTIVLSSSVSGTTYSWTRNNTTTVTGIAASGNTDISGTLTNTTNAPVTVTFTITPTANGCPGPTTTATVTVAPTPTVDPVANQTVCNGTMTAPVNFTGPVAGTIYNWTNSTPSIGLAASGTGNIAAFTGTNATTLPVTGTVTVTPSVVIPSDNVPEILYYKFDGSGTSVPNQASAPPSGTATATIVGGQTQGGSGICNGTLIGSGNSSTTNYVNTNWATSLTGTSWSLSFKTSNIQPSTTLFYIFGDNTANSFRCFTNGVAGSNNWMLRGPVGDIIVPGGATVAPHTTTFVYDNVTGQLRGYLDGVLVVTNAQAPPTIAGTGPFKVGAYGGNTGLPTGGLMDEFRLYSRALSLTEIQELANGCAGGSTTCTGPTSTFTITVNPTPTITCPANITVPSTVGACTAVVTYAPAVTGTPTPTLSYVLTGATTGSGTGSGSGTAFRVGVTTVTVTATNICATISCSFTVTVTDSQLPVINTQPANRTVCAGTSATFSVAAVTAPSAGGPLSYQWQLWNGSTWNDIAGATASTYTVTNPTVSQNTNSYRVRVIGLCTTITSTHATLYVNPLPTINLTTSIPPNLLPTQVLTITATTAPGGGSFVWFKNGVVIAGASGSSLANLTVSDIGTYRVVYTGPNGCVVTSSDVVITGQQSDNLYIYPVPNNGDFNVRFYNLSNELVTLRVIDAKGAEVYRRKVQTTIPYTTINVDLSSNRILASGVYVVEMRRSDGSLAGSRKIIVYK